jgi:hypothetical protein
VLGPVDHDKWRKAEHPDRGSPDMHGKFPSAGAAEVPHPFSSSSCPRATPDRDARCDGGVTFPCQDG